MEQVGQQRDKSTVSKTSSQAKPAKKQAIRQVNDYLVFSDEVLGIGQYGRVVKAVKSTPKSQGKEDLLAPAKPVRQQTYACKIIEVQNVSKEDMACIVKEVQIHSMVHSQYAVKLYQTIKTKSNIYMFQDFCNGCDLSLLLRLKGQLTQQEARLILIQLSIGLQDIWQLQIIHRDMKLANVLLNFPDNPEMNDMPREQKKKFLKKVDLTKINFEVKISDFGLSTILDANNPNNTNLSICGTPLYSSPQLLLKKGYNAKVDAWALGVVLYELLTGTTPFHSFEMKDLLNKIKTGKYSLSINEPLTIECVLFLVQCLQANEELRISKENLHKHIFIDLELTETPLDVDQFYKELNEQALVNTIVTDQTNGSISEAESSQLLQGNTSIQLSTKGTEQEQILLGMLVSDSLGMSMQDEESKMSVVSSSYDNSSNITSTLMVEEPVKQKEKSNLDILAETMDKKKMAAVRKASQDQSEETKSVNNQSISPSIYQSEVNTVEETKSKTNQRQSKEIKQYQGSIVSDAYDKKIEQKVQANKRRNPIGRFFGFMNAKLCRTNQPARNDVDKAIEENTANRIRQSIKERRQSHRNSTRTHSAIPIKRGANDVIEQGSPKFARATKDY